MYPPPYSIRYIYIFLFTYIYIYRQTATGAGFSVNIDVNKTAEFCLHLHNCLKINVFDVNKIESSKIPYL
jgi:hypothetical protein